MQWSLIGPAEGSYSLSLVNRNLSQGLRAQGVDLRPWSLTDAAPEVLLVNDFPPFPKFYSPQGLNLFASYAWEETGYPWGWVQAINTQLQGLTVVSPYVKKILREAGVYRPIAVVGNGVDHVPQAAIDRPTGSRFKFLHISTGLARKGLDPLVQAFIQAFTMDDPVELIIKTTPNDTNRVTQALSPWQALGHSRPHLTVIDEDWPAERLWALMAQADVLVMPSRAEGFGLPLAEAATLGALGMVTDLGGPRAFAHATNALLIPSQFAPSGSHLGPHLADGLDLQDSLWLEPSIPDLAALMKAAVAMPATERRAKAAQMAQTIAEDFTWLKVARRTIQAVQTLSQTRQSPGRGAAARLGWVSTFNSRCGIATYSSHLVNGLRDQGLSPIIFANADAQPLSAQGEAQVQRLWRQHSFMWSTLAGGLWAHGCDQVVFQHNPGLYPTRGLAQTGAFLAGMGKHCYADLHSTDELETAIDQDPQTLVQLRQFKRLLVHSVRDMNRLKALGLADQACLFPHGVYPAPTPEDIQSAVQWLRAHAPWPHTPSKAPLLACFGFVMKHKGFEQLLQALTLMPSESAPRLLMLTALYPAEDSRAESARLQALIEQWGLQNRVLRATEFLPEALAVALLAQANLTIYPYQHTNESASGAVRMALAARCPVAVTPLDIFEDVQQAVGLLPGCDPQAIATGITALLANPDQLETLRASAEHYAQSHQWPQLAQRLANILRGDWEDPFPDGLLPLV